MNDFSLVVPEQAYASSVAVTVDLLRSAASAAPHFGLTPPAWVVRSLDGGPVTLSGGMSLTTQKLPIRSHADRSTWIIPGMGYSDKRTLMERLERDDARRLGRAIAVHIERGGRVAASCTSVFLLHTAGVLDSLQVTTSWWMAALLQRLCPTCKVDARRMLCTDGAITTAGAAFAQVDLMLHLIRTWAGVRQGPQLTDMLCRTLLMDARQEQTRYIAPELLANSSSPIQRMTAIVEKTLPATVRIADIARQMGMSERTLARQVKLASGHTPTAVVQSIRAQMARQMRTGARMKQEAMAEALGYADTTALRRLLRRHGM